MSITRAEVVEYPESDGQPVGETDFHIDWIFRLRDILKTRFKDQRVYVASNLLVYYEEGNPKKFVVPDAFVVFDCEPGSRRTFKLWVEQRVPNVVFEVTSRSTAKVDLEDKRELYARLGVQEYFLYDPEAEYLDPQLQGYRLVDNEFVPMEWTNGCLLSQLCGCQLGLYEGNLVLLDIKTGEVWLTAAEENAGLREEIARLKSQLGLSSGSESESKPH